MDTSNFWWQSAGDGPGPGPGPDPGDFIGQSLRFNAAQSQHLSRTPGTGGNRRTWTYSGWYKLSEKTAGKVHMALLGWGGNSGTRTQTYFSDLDANAFVLLDRTNNANITTKKSTAQYRDQSAWYHLVISVDTTQAVANDRYRIFINGEQIDSFSTNTIGSQNTQTQINNTVIHFLGHYPGDAADQRSWFDGYLADVYLIDGQALEPTAFGRYNTEGVWVPDDYDGTYGTNGFHLDFADPNDLGADRSGNGNDFTATGFNTDPVGIWETQLEVEPGATEHNPNVFSRGFDGDINTWAWVDNPNTSFIRFAPTTPIPFTSELAYYADDSATGNTSSWNGNSFTGGPGVGWKVFSGSGEISTTTPLTIQRSGTETNNFRAIRVDGTILVDNTGADYDSMDDSPTQNWATLNPLLTYSGSGGLGPSATADGNLTLSGTTNTVQKLGLSTFGAKGRVYVEMRQGSIQSGGSGIVIYTGTQPRQSGLYYGDPKFFQFFGDGNVGQGNGATAITILSTLTNWVGEPNVASLALDMDSGEAWFAVNGVWQGGNPETGTGPNLTGLNANQDYAFIGMTTGNSNDNPSINFGQQPFLYTPPAGFEALQTQNMPEVAITDGRDHFQVITGPGTGANTTDPNAILGAFSTTWSASGDGFGSTPPVNAFDDNTTNWCNNNSGGQTVTWDTSSFNLVGELTISMRSGGNYTMSIDGVEVISSITQNSTPDDYTVTVNNPNSIVWAPVGASAGIYLHNFQLDGNNLRDGNILAIAQQTFPNGLWWIKDRVNSNQNQLVDSVTNAHQGGGNWAFDCPTYADIKNYVAPAGSSVAWCWNYNDVNPAENGFEIIIDNQATQTRAINHRLGAVPDMIISRGHRFTNGHWRVHFKEVGYSETLFLSTSGPAAVTDQRVTAASTTTFTYGNEAGAVGQDFTHYVFAAVPGYSAFGSYTGNANPDGPFIYTGFRPAFVMIKNTGLANNWYIGDTTRNPNNGSMLILAPNESQAENSASNNFDILSNGFKLRTSDSATNGAHTLVYACFAENPFGGSNVSPANAR